MSKTQIVRTLRSLSMESRNFSMVRTSKDTAMLSNTSIKDQRRKTKIILTLLFAIALTSSITLMVASFLPVFVDGKYDGINLTLTGLIIRSLLAKNGKKKCDYLWYYNNGYSNFPQRCNIISFSLITIEFAEDQEKYLGWAEAATGMGLAIGPTLGSLVYEEVGYLYTFIIFGGLLLLGVIQIFFTLPRRLNDGYSQSQDVTQERSKFEIIRNNSDDSYMNKIRILDNSNPKNETIKVTIPFEGNDSLSEKEVTYGMFIKNPRCLITLIGCSMVNILIDFLNSILSVQLKNYYTLSEAYIGFIFAIPFFVYVIGFYFVSKVVVREENHTLNDKASGIFNGFVAFGAIIAPIVGGSLSDSIGYQSSNDALAFLSSAYTVSFILVWFFTRKQDQFEHLPSVMRSVQGDNSSYRMKSSQDRRNGSSLNDDSPANINDQLIIKQFSGSYLQNQKLQDYKESKLSPSKMPRLESEHFTTQKNLLKHEQDTYMETQ
ncbi:permeases of the major facilitator superfamily [Stylonychia lemnae]|uniref:Permeases of the major facilitator superfamily n=1 Tax=Stylonychia lemnae TaxID=5949 RepID=A0A078A0E9_STYLE|nr:permeases of the major facilitator superfamily [Stylonychia lemnae]|eukprot:CDW74258.1 permeases of the major facilitator superfamily [Stylonychia lemnae]